MTAQKIVLVESDNPDGKPTAFADQPDLAFLVLAYQPGLVSLVQGIAPDLLVLHSAVLSTPLLQDLQQLNRVYACPVIVFTQDNHPDTIKRAMQAEVSDYLLEPLTLQRLEDSIPVAQARFRQQQQLKTLLAEAQAKLEDRKKIDQAKAILIKTRHYTEDEAYHTLRKLAMDRHMTLGEMAKQVIAMADLLK
jgi:response regulator NasT